MYTSKMAQKRKRLVLTLPQKLGIVNWVEKGERVKKSLAEFGIGEQTVREAWVDLPPTMFMSENTTTRRFSSVNLCDMKQEGFKL